MGFSGTVENKLKDMYIFSDYLFNKHGLLLVIIGFILTAAMVVSIIISKDLTSRQ
jgi:hypothetical protein